MPGCLRDIVTECQDPLLLFAGTVSTSCGLREKEIC